jgi:hypothetical protein
MLEVRTLRYSGSLTLSITHKFPRRGEYLAQYLFSAFGTAIPVAYKEDSGVDFYCTVTERLGQRAWPRAYFTVQVKSGDKPWIFNGKESVRWLIEQPLPLYICVVDKRELRFRVYQTFARFHIWSLGIQSGKDYLEALDYLGLIPGAPGTGACTSWDGGRQISLRAPILDITLTQITDDDERIAETRDVLNYWLDLDKTNLSRIATGTLNFAMPQQYQTNTIEFINRTATRTFGKTLSNVTDAELRSCFVSLRPSFLWVARVLMYTGDPLGAALAAMLMRYWNPEDIDSFDIAARLNRIAGIEEPKNDCLSLNQLYSFQDEMIAGVGARLGVAQSNSADKPKD